MQINFAQLIFQAVNFGLLLFILTKFLYKPVLKLLEERNRKIATGLKAAESNLKEKQAIEELKHRQLIKAETEAAAVLEAARKQAESTGKDIIAAAKTAAAAEVKKEYQLLAEKLQAEQKKLKSQIAGLVMDTTRSVLSDTLSSQDQQSIIKKQIAQLKTISIPKA